MKSFTRLSWFFGVSLLVTSCYKPGCTDPYADNYDPDANTSDLKCDYNGDVVFWAKPHESDSLINLGHDTLRFELEGTIVDSVATANLVAITGDCHTSGTKTINRQFTGNNERSYKYRVKGHAFETIYEGFVTIKAAGCEPVRLD